MTKYLEPVDYLPHRAPMILIDKVTEVTEDSAVCESYVGDKGVLKNFIDKEGNLPSYFTIELISQSVGVWSGYIAKLHNIDIPPMGMVLGARDLKYPKDHFVNGSTLKIHVKKIMDDGAIASFDGEIFSDNKALASGRVNLIRVTDNDLKRLFKRD